MMKAKNTVFCGWFLKQAYRQPTCNCPRQRRSNTYAHQQWFSLCVRIKIITILIVQRADFIVLMHSPFSDKRDLKNQLPEEGLVHESGRTLSL